MLEDIEQLHREIKALKAPEAIADKLPPPCFRLMDGKWESYVSRKALSASFPVLETFTNPLGNMQGGFIAAAFDNTFGPLSFVAARAPTVTIDMNVQYIRAIAGGERLFVKAQIVTRGFATLYLTAEASNGDGKLIATAGTNMMILKRAAKA